MPTMPPPTLTRGSAPADAFDIPEGGFRIPDEDSFVLRFRNSLARKHLSLDNARVPGEPDASVVALPPLSKSMSAPVPADLVRAVADVQVSGNNGVDGDVMHGQDVSGPSGSPLDELGVSDDDADDTGTVIIADDDDDISDVPGVDTLLTPFVEEQRLSFPALRFCAGMGLADQSALDAMGLPLGFVWSPFGELPNIRQVTRAARRCGTCGSFVAKGNGGEEVAAGANVWTCGFCGRNDNDVGEAGLQGAAPDPDEFPELVSDCIDYQHPESAIRSSGGRGAIIMIVDENMEPEEAEWARMAVAAVHESAVERRLRFAMLTVGAGAAIAVQSADMASSPATLESLSVERATKLTPDKKELFFMRPAEHGSSEIGLSSVTSSCIRARSVSCFNDSDPAHGARLHPDDEPRRLDIALSIAFELISGMADSENSRILSLMTGPPTLAGPALHTDAYGKDGQAKQGDGHNDAHEDDFALGRLYEQLGSRAGEQRIALDFLSFGTNVGFGSTILLGAAKRSRGGMVYAAAHSYSSGAALAQAASFLVCRSTSPGVVSIRVSGPLSVARVIGPAFATAAPHTYAVPGVDPTAGFTVILQTKASADTDAELPSHVVIQLAAKSLTSTRVMTARIPLTRDPVKFMSSIDAEVCALVLGKACVVSGTGLTDPIVAARSIDVTTRRLLEASESTAGIVRLLFELRRGFLLENQIHEDSSLVLRCFFLRTECAIASLLMSPRLFTNTMTEESTGLMAEIPLDRSCIKDDAVLVLDSGLNVYVYVGKNATETAEAAVSDSARGVASTRSTPCQLWKVRGGEEAEELLLSYLAPEKEFGLRKKLPIGAAHTQPRATEMTFLEYCTILAPECYTVELMQETAKVA